MELAASEAPTPPRLDVSRVIRRTAQIYWARGGLLIPLAIMIIGIPGLVGDYGASHELIGLTLASLLFQLLGSFWYAGFVAEIVRREEMGSQDLALGSVVARVMPFTLRLIAVGALAEICIFLGFVALIVPGIFLAIRFSLVAPAVVIDGSTATGALDRSNRVVKGNSWRMVLLLLALFGIGVALGLVVGLLGRAFSVDADIRNFVFGSAFGPFFVLPLALTYLQLATGRPLGDEASPSAATPA